MGAERCFFVMNETKAKNIDENLGDAVYKLPKIYYKYIWKYSVL